MSKIMNVYYGHDLLPYKDKELQVHYPIVGQAFQGASQTTEIKFYIDNIDIRDDSVWLAVSKIANGQIGYNILEKAEDDDGTYVSLQLNRWHTQYKGDIFINLQAYDGGVEYEEDENDMLHPVGVPIIEVTGSIKLTIAYATGIVEGGDVDIHTLQELLAYLGNYLRHDSDKYLKVVDQISDINTSALHEYINRGDIVYDKSVKKYYYVNSGSYPNFVYQEISGLDFLQPILNAPQVYQEARFFGSIKVDSYEDVYDENNQTLVDYIASQISGASNTYVTLATDQTISGHKTFTTTITAQSGVNFGNSANANMYNGYILNNRIKLFGIGTSSNNRTFYQFPYGSISDNQHGENNPYTIATQEYTASYVGTYAYSKGDVDQLLSTVKANAFQVVEELPQQGVEGVIYLVPLVGGSGYTQYIWEGNDYINLGDTSIDLSGYLQKSSQTNKVYGTNGSGLQTLYDISSSNSANTIAFRTTGGVINVGTPANGDGATPKSYVDNNFVAKTLTISGIALSGNISSQDLTDSLVFMNNTTDMDYVMED